MSFYRRNGLSSVEAVVFVIAGLFSLYAIFAGLFFAIRTLMKGNDELVKKLLRDALASTAVVLILLHLAQMIIRDVYFRLTGNDINLIITSGLFIPALGDFGKLHLEAFGFDMSVFALFFNFYKWRYR